MRGFLKTLGSMLMSLLMVPACKAVTALFAGFFLVALASTDQAGRDAIAKVIARVTVLLKAFVELIATSKLVSSSGLFDMR
jgi:hypothetical protein